jgi:hypothetical protein
MVKNVATNHFLPGPVQQPFIDRNARFIAHLAEPSGQ